MIRNKIFETLLELELAVCDFVSNLSVDIIKSVCEYNYNVYRLEIGIIGLMSVLITLQIAFPECGDEMVIELL